MKTAPEPTPNFPDLDSAFECPHLSGYSRICGQCMAKLRAEGFQEGYSKGLADGTPEVVDHSPKQKTWSGTYG